MKTNFTIDQKNLRYGGFTRSGRAVSLARLLVLLCLGLCGGHVWGQPTPVPLVVPPEPAVKPAIPSIWEVDKDGNLIEDIIDKKIADAQATLNKPDATPAERAQAQQVLNEAAPVILSFSRQITLDELNAFAQLGGEVTYIFQANYGWVGIIARGKIPQVVAHMKQGFLGITTGDKPVRVHMHIATRTGRAAVALGVQGERQYHNRYPRLGHFRR